MSSSNVVWEVSGSIGTLTFNRPQARNALTWDMYDALLDACERTDAGPLRVLILRGAGGAFASGTDIAQFSSLRSGEDGIAYERRLDAVIDRLERVRRVTIAAVDGAATGGGCAIALACDLRIATPHARFGVPVARTLGNCLSAANLARLVDQLGPCRTREVMLTGRLLEADEALALGLVTRVVPAGQLDDEVRALAEEMTGRATSTIEATKAMLSHLRDHRRPPPGDDIISHCYTSDDFREGVSAFLERRPPKWKKTDATD